MIFSKEQSAEWAYKLSLIVLASEIFLSGAAIATYFWAEQYLALMKTDSYLPAFKIIVFTLNLLIYTSIILAIIGLMSPKRKLAFKALAITILSTIVSIGIGFLVVILAWGKIPF